MVALSGAPCSLALVLVSEGGASAQLSRGHEFTLMRQE